MIVVTAGVLRKIFSGEPLTRHVGIIPAGGRPKGSKEWWELWQESGHWHERGPGKSYCMARYGDSGAYAVENVYICTVGENFSDSYIVKPWHERWPSGHPGSHARKGRGWTYISKLKTNPYRAQCAKKYLGQFPTAEAAHAAYLEARRQLLGGNGKARA